MYTHLHFTDKTPGNELKKSVGRARVSKYLVIPQWARKFKTEIAIMAVLNFLPVQKLIFGHF